MTSSKVAQWINDNLAQQTIVLAEALDTAPVWTVRLTLSDGRRVLLTGEHDEGFEFEFERKEAKGDE